MSSRTYVRDLVFRNILRFFRANPSTTRLVAMLHRNDKFAIWFSLYRTQVILYKNRAKNHNSHIIFEIFLFYVFLYVTKRSDSPLCHINDSNHSSSYSFSFIHINLPACFLHQTQYKTRQKHLFGHFTTDKTHLKNLLYKKIFQYNKTLSDLIKRPGQK